MARVGTRSKRKGLVLFGAGVRSTTAMALLQEQGRYDLDYVTIYHRAGSTAVSASRRLDRVVSVLNHFHQRETYMLSVETRLIFEHGPFLLRWYLDSAAMMARQLHIGEVIYTGSCPTNTTYEGVQVLNPLKDVSAVDIYRQAERLALPFGNMYLCDNPPAPSLACGKCARCQQRKGVLRGSGVRDPAYYQAHTQQRGRGRGRLRDGGH